MSEDRPPGDKPLRADIFLTQHGYFPSRARSRAEIEAGTVSANGQVVVKPGQMLGPETVIALSAVSNPYVSRGGLKLAHGLKTFPVPVRDAVAVDLGASTGGFTQVLLEAGAAHVFAVDVGADQLHDSLRADPRVTVLEGTNARDLSEEIIVQPIDLIVSDVSFISLKLALPPALALAKPGAHLIVLIKPQFEAGREFVGKSGVVKDPAIREAVCTDIAAWLKGQGWTVTGLEPSPIKGPEGNEEFLIAAHKAS